MVIVLSAALTLITSYNCMCVFRQKTLFKKKRKCLFHTSCNWTATTFLSFYRIKLTLSLHFEEKKNHWIFPLIGLLFVASFYIESKIITQIMYFTWLQLTWCTSSAYYCLQYHYNLLQFQVTTILLLNIKPDIQDITT